MAENRFYTCIVSDDGEVGLLKRRCSTRGLDSGFRGKMPQQAETRGGGMVMGRPSKGGPLPRADSHRGGTLLMAVHLIDVHGVYAAPPPPPTGGLHSASKPDSCTDRIALGDLRNPVTATRPKTGACCPLRRGF